MSFIERLKREWEILQRFLDLQEETFNELYFDIKTYYTYSCFIEKFPTDISTSSGY